MSPCSFRTYLYMTWVAIGHPTDSASPTETISLTSYHIKLQLGHQHTGRGVTCICDCTDTKRCTCTMSRLTSCNVIGDWMLDASSLHTSPGPNVALVGLAIPVIYLDILRTQLGHDDSLQEDAHSFCTESQRCQH